MGYYDQEETPKQKSSRGRAGSFFAGLGGAVIGGVLVLSAVPTLSKLDVLPYTVSQESTSVEQSNTGTKVEAKNITNVSTQVTKAYDKVAEAVVGVVNIQQTSFWGQTTEKDEEAGSGSGVIYKKAGNKAYVVTNNHVVEGASKLEVNLKDGTKVPARLLGTDTWTDLAVLEIDATHVKTVAELGNSDQVRTGEPVIAIGNPLGQQFSSSVTEGIISGTNRTIEEDLDKDGIPDWQVEVLQTDAAINPGNSGGALVNMEGKVIGINSMKIAEQAVEGIGLAIPISNAIPVINDLEKYNEVRRPYMGLSLKSLSEIPQYYLEEALHLPKNITKGVAILEVSPSSPAAKTGLKEFDVIVALDDKPMDDVIQLRKHLYNDKKIGDSMKVTFYRNGKKETVTIKLVKESL